MSKPELQIVLSEFLTDSLKEALPTYIKNTLADKYSPRIVEKLEKPGLIYTTKSDILFRFLKEEVKFNAIFIICEENTGSVVPEVSYEGNIVLTEPRAMNDIYDCAQKIYVHIANCKIVDQGVRSAMDSLNCILYRYKNAREHFLYLISKLPAEFNDNDRKYLKIYTMLDEALGSGKLDIIKKN